MALATNISPRIPVRPNTASPQTLGGVKPLDQNADKPLPRGTVPGSGGIENGVADPFLLAGFPAFQPISFPTIKAAPYKFTDPLAYAGQIADTNNAQIGKNFSTAEDFSLSALDTELKGLDKFVPAAAALKRSELSIDNQFNQRLRTNQVNDVLPNAKGDLLAQRNRALAYAGGRLPDDNLDRSFELGIRSNAADKSFYGGFGPKSLQSSKTSDLMSADERFQISQYGENLLNNNLTTESNLYLAPTEYSNAGSEVSVKPEVGAGRLTYQGLGALDEATLLSPAAALQTAVQQNQFTTGLEQQTRQFNATGQFGASEFNSSGAFTAALGQFQYNVDYLNAVQSANQGQLNNFASTAMQGQQQQSFSSGQGAAQSAGTIGSTLSALGSLAGTANSLSPSDSEPVGKTSVSTQPSEQTAATQPTSTPVSSSIIPSVSRAVAADSTTPSSYKFSSAQDVPSSYTPVARSADGGYIAANTEDYKNDLDRFARSSNNSGGGIKIENAAAADRALSSTAGLSYIPLQGFKPLAITNGGKAVYGSSALMDSGNSNLGGSSVNTLMQLASQLGVADEGIFSALGETANAVSDPEFLNSLDKLNSEKGQKAVTQAIVSKIGGKGSKDDNASQQLNFGAHRVGELWSALSPAQKSLALSSLTASAVKLKSGKEVATQVVPGTERAPGGALKVGDAISLATTGHNGLALARNWNQLSAVADMVGGAANNPGLVSQLSDKAGLLGFGPQGAAVALKQGHLAKVGAVPVPELGIGAAIFDRKDQVPQGYKIVTQMPNGKPVALPANSTHTALINATKNPLAYQKAQQVSSGTHPAQKLWGKAPSRITTKVPVVRGSDGGSAMVAGLGLMRKSNPRLLSSIAAHSFFNNTVGS